MPAQTVYVPVCGNYLAIFPQNPENKGYQPEDNNGQYNTCFSQHKCVYFISLELKLDTLHIQLIQIHCSNLQCLPVSKVSYAFKRHFANLVKEFGGSRIYGHNIL